MVRMRGATEGWKRKLAMMVEVFEVAVDGAFDGGGTMWSTMVAWWWWFPSEKGRRRRKRYHDCGPLLRFHGSSVTVPLLEW